MNINSCSKWSKKCIFIVHEADGVSALLEWFLSLDTIYAAFYRVLDVVLDRSQNSTSIVHRSIRIITENNPNKMSTPYPPGCLTRIRDGCGTSWTLPPLLPSPLPPSRNPPIHSRPCISSRGDFPLPGGFSAGWTSLQQVETLPRGTCTLVPNPHGRWTFL